jgi:mannitol/fructose-specific phosphotransferase system IIA component (Ntr-type)
VLAIGKAPGGIDFESIDGKPVTLIVLLLGPSDQTGPHIQALACISRVLSIDADRKAIEDAATPEAMFKAIAKAEERE